MTQPWQTKANCKGRTELFFGHFSERPASKKKREVAAQKLCSECPVIYECRKYARENNELGYWGGETEDERFRAGYLRNSTVSRRNKARDVRSSTKVQ